MQHFINKGAGCNIYRRRGKTREFCNKPEGCGFESRRDLRSLNRLNPSGRTMAQGLPPPLTEMSKRNISMGKRWPVRRADNLATFIC